MANDLFAASGLDHDVPRPLADRMRPTRLGDVVGQDHIVGPEGTLTRMLAGGRLTSILLWGPPGVGKTTIAQLLAAQTTHAFQAVSAVFSGVKDLRAAFEAAEARRRTGQGTLLFVDEIHRFNRAQQDSFLPYVERGTVTLVGATTENPSFEINGALLSRCTVLTLHRLDETSLDQLARRAEAAEGRALPFEDDARQVLVAMADGDGRYLLNLVEQIYAQTTPDDRLDRAALAHLLRKRATAHDRDRDGHFNLISALHKAVRGSDPDAALYWLARMVEGGEDPAFLSRRLIRMASEDIGLADPTALMIANEAARTYERLGSPEGELALAHAVIHLATAPKSNAAHVAWKAAQTAARTHGSLAPPRHILNAPTGLMREAGYGAGYVYDHDVPDAFSGQNYFPEGMARETFYVPTDRGREAAIGERLARWVRLRRERGEGGHEP